MNEESKKGNTEGNEGLMVSLAMLGGVALVIAVIIELAQFLV